MLPQLVASERAGVTLPLAKEENQVMCILNHNRMPAPLSFQQNGFSLADAVSEPQPLGALPKGPAPTRLEL